MGRIFISYSHRDSETVSFINDFLSEHHVFTWFDRKSIAPGSHWETNIATSISSCNTFLVFHSRSYTASSFCRREWELIVDRNRVVAPTVIVVGLDDSRDSLVFDDVTRYQFIDFDFRHETKEELGQRLLSLKAVRRCSLSADDIPVVSESTGFFDALQSMHSPKHYETLETLARFALLLRTEESKGRYLSREANFDDLAASLLSDGSLRLVPIAGAYSDVPDPAAREIFLRNVFFAMFKYSAVYRFTQTPPPVLEFGSPYTSATHRFAKRTAEDEQGGAVRYDADAEIYALFNRQIAKLYEKLPDLDDLAEAFSDILNASRFYESQETRYDGSRSLDYEYTPLVLTVARALFMIQNPPRTDLSYRCIPLLREGDARFSCHAAFERSEESLYLHGNDGGGKTSILLDWFYTYPRTLYIDLARGLYFGVREVLRGALSGTDPSCYKLDFAGLFKYSLYRERVTLLVDGIEMLSEKKRDRILAELYELRDVFRIVLVSTKLDLENKLSLTVSGSLTDGFRRYELCPPEKEQIVEYIRFRLGKLQTPYAAEIVEGFERLDTKDPLFLFFNSFTKLDILLGAISDWDSFSIEELHQEFNTRIKVYQRIFESHSEYSMKRKIASYFRGLVVDIEDIILKLVDSEVEAIKKMAYENTSLPVPVREASELRFRDYYPVLSCILGNYFFVNEDIRNYFVASYINSAVRRKPPEPEALEELLSPVETNYGVLEYLHEFDLLGALGDPELFLEECEGRERLILILYRIIQYYDGEVRDEFLRCVSFPAIPDKFFFRADNIERIAVPPCVREIGRAAFANMPRLREIDFAPLGGGSPLSIRPWAILNCPALERIRLGRGYTQYRHPLFGRCKALRRIELDPANPAFSTLLDGQILASKDGERLFCAVNSLEGELHIPEGVKVIGNNALSYLTKVTRILLPASLREADTNFTDFCDVLMRIDVEKENPVFYSDEDGLLYTDREEGKVLFRVPSGKEGELRLRGDIAVIGSDSISCCTCLDTIYVPTSVRLIENYAFADTYSLRKIVFEDIDRVTAFGNYIFLSANPRVRIFGGSEYDLAGFHAAYSRPRSDDRLKGIVRQPVRSSLFPEHGLELLRAGEPREHYSAAVLVRDVTLFNDHTYHEKDFNILLIGLTEYNAILTRDKQEADKYVEGLIERFHISAVVLSRDLPLVSQLESEEKYGRLLIARGEGGSTAVTKKIAAIIAQLGESHD